MHDARLTIFVHHGEHRARQTFDFDWRQTSEDERRDDLRDALTYCLDHPSTGIGHYLPNGSDSLEQIVSDLLDSASNDDEVCAGWVRMTLAEV